MAVASIQSFFPPTPQTSPSKYPATLADASSSPIRGNDGFTSSEVQEALRSKPAEAWQPTIEYTDREIRDLYPGSGAVMFMGRVAVLFDVRHTSGMPQSAKGCVKLCVKDDTGAVTVRLWHAKLHLKLRLGSLISVWTTHISNGEHSTLSSSNAPLFTSIFPERDRSCHLMVHENSDDGSLCRTPLGLRPGEPLSGLMTLQNFVDGGCDVADAKVVVVVKSVGAKKSVARKDGTANENVVVHIQDDTSEAALGLYGSATCSPFQHCTTDDHTIPDAVTADRAWKAGETILLLHAPNCKPTKVPYLSLSACSIVDVDPDMPDAAWLRTWALRQRSREAINPAFPEGVFDHQMIKSGPVRCLYTIGDLDEVARAATDESFQGYLSVIVMESKLYDCWKRQMLFSGECCTMPLYANDLTTKCRGCDRGISLNLNLRILGEVVDETGRVAAGKMLFSLLAWRDLLGRNPEDLLDMGIDEIKHLSDRLLFCRLTLVFGWTGDMTQAGGRICVLRVRS